MEVRLPPPPQQPSVGIDHQQQDKGGDGHPTMSGSSSIAASANVWQAVSTHLLQQSQDFGSYPGQQGELQRELQQSHPFAPVVQTEEVQHEEQRALELALELSRATAAAAPVTEGAGSSTPASADWEHVPTCTE